jgi:hypothetical protein
MPPLVPPTAPAPPPLPPLVLAAAYDTARVPDIPPTAGAAARAANPVRPWNQGLTLVHFSAQFKPCLTLKNTLHTLNSP